MGAQRRHDPVDAVQRDRAARRRGPASGPAAPLLRQHRSARADRLAAGQRGRAGGPGRAEQPHAGGRQRRQRGHHARRGARAGPVPGAVARRLGASAGLRARPGRQRTGRAVLSDRHRPRRGRRRPAGGRGAAVGPARARRARAGMGRGQADHRVPDPARHRGVRRRGHHLRSPAVPPRADRDDDRPGRRAAGPGRRARAGTGRGGPRPRRGHGGLAPEVGLPGHDEPRDPDPAQRCDRPQRPPAPHVAHARSSTGCRPVSTGPAGCCSG